MVNDFGMSAVDLPNAQCPMPNAVVKGDTTCDLRLYYCRLPTAD